VEKLSIHHPREDSAEIKDFCRAIPGRFIWMVLTAKLVFFVDYEVGLVGFEGFEVGFKWRSLSGGEKTRLSITTLMLKDNNFLILDEPTTYLDVLSQRIILDALKMYEGTLLVVSHTPDFLRELKSEKALLLPEEKYVYWDNSLLETVAEMLGKDESLVRSTLPKLAFVKYCIRLERLDKNLVSPYLLVEQ